MQALANAFSTRARAILFSAREQMSLIVNHGMVPGFVLMTSNDYNTLKGAVGDDYVCHNSDTDTINGLQIVIDEKTPRPTVMATPSSLSKAGLL